MLGWFIDEQVEGRRNGSGYIDALKMIKDNGFGIYTLDKELGARTYTWRLRWQENKCRFFISPKQSTLSTIDGVSFCNRENL